MERDCESELSKLNIEQNACIYHFGASVIHGQRSNILRLRQIRSIQTEGHFGDIKENDSFRRFNYRTSEKVYKEFMLYAIGRNINKYHRFLYEKIKKFEGKTEEKAA